jgi:hypothetical protein
MKEIKKTWYNVKYSTYVVSHTEGGGSTYWVLVCRMCVYVLYGWVGGTDGAMESYMGGIGRGKEDIGGWMERNLRRMEGEKKFE